MSSSVRPLRTLLAALLLVAPGAGATAACPVQPHYPLPTEAAALRATLAHINQQQDQCLRSSPYYAWRGALQLALGQPSAAIESLERALLLQPDLPGAQLDYAQALLAQGDTIAALDLLRLLAARRDLPPPIRSLLAQLQQTHPLLAATTLPLGTGPLNPFTRWQLSSALGWDSNLNSAPHTDSLTLSLPGLPGTSIALPLERSSQPQPGLHALTQLGVQHLQPLGEGGGNSASTSAPSALLLSAQLANRSTRTYSKTHYQHAELALHWLQAPLAPAQWVLGSQYSHLRYGGQAWLSEWQLSAQRQRQWGPCRASAGAQWAQRQWHSSPELDGHYQGAILSLDCTPAAPTTNSSSTAAAASAPRTWGLQLRWGHDQPQHSRRPGGRATRTELRAHASTGWGPWQLSAIGHYQIQRDQQGYSPLLDTGRPRHTQRHALELQASRPLPWWGTVSTPASPTSPTTDTRPGQLHWIIGLQYSQQRSNIAVFAVRQHGIHTGLRWLH